MADEQRRYWDAAENFAGPMLALQRDGFDRVYVRLLMSHVSDDLEMPPGSVIADKLVIALPDEDWIAWQALITAAPLAMGSEMKPEESGGGRPG